MLTTLHTPDVEDVQPLHDQFWAIIGANYPDRVHVVDADAAEAAAQRQRRPPLRSVVVITATAPRPVAGAGRRMLLSRRDAVPRLRVLPRERSPPSTARERSRTSRSRTEVIHRRRSITSSES